MVRNPLKFVREKKNLRLQPRVFISCEGKVTERLYFSLLRELFPEITFLITKKGDNKSAPYYVVKRMKDLQKEGRFTAVSKEGAKDYAFLVMDIDGRQDSSFEEVKEWLKANAEHHFVVISNPKFELWLLLHYEEAKGVITPLDCDEHLKRFIKNYQKTLPNDFPMGNTGIAVERALKKCPCWKVAWETPGTTSFGCFIKKLEAISKDG